MGRRHAAAGEESLLCGFYLNELLVKLLARDDPHPALFDHYVATLNQLAHDEPAQIVLRKFERALLKETGVAADLSRCDDAPAPGSSRAGSTWSIRNAVRASRRPTDAGPVVSGKTLLDMERGRLRRPADAGAEQAADALPAGVPPGRRAAEHAPDIDRPDAAVSIMPPPHDFLIHDEKYLLPALFSCCRITIPMSFLQRHAAAHHAIIIFSSFFTAPPVIACRPHIRSVIFFFFFVVMSFLPPCRRLIPLSCNICFAPPARHLTADPCVNHRPRRHPAQRARHRLSRPAARRAAGRAGRRRPASPCTCAKTAATSRTPTCARMRPQLHDAHEPGGGGDRRR